MKTLAIFSPNEKSYSETFIQWHKKLPFKIKYYYGGYLPTKLENSETLYKFDFFTKLKKRINSTFSWSEVALINSLKRENVDCVLSEYGLTACATLKVIMFLKLPLIVHFFGFDASNKSIIEQYHESYKLVFAYAKHVVVVSEKMRQDLINLGCPSQKIVLTYCGPDNSFFNTKPHYHQPQFLSIGRFVDKKAPYLTIAAFREVVFKFPNAKLVMVGEGALLNTCKNLTKLWSIQNNVDFVGFKSPNEIFTLFEDSLAFVQHSIISDDGDSEGTPVAILDAQAAQLPVISTFHAGIADVIIDNETGLLVHEQDVNGMSRNMLRILEEQGLAQKLGTAGKKRVAESFSIEKHLSVLEKLIENV